MWALFSGVFFDGSGVYQKWQTIVFVASIKFISAFSKKKSTNYIKKDTFLTSFSKKKRRRGEMGPNNKEYNMCYVCIGMLKGDYFFRGGGLSTKSKYLLIIMFLEFYFTHHKIMNSQRRLWPKYIGFICTIY